MDGVMTDVNGNSVADVAAVYRIGDAGMVLTFTKPVTNINGKPVSAYNGAQLSPDGKTLYLNGRNDGADIVVNQTGDSDQLPLSAQPRRGAHRPHRREHRGHAGRALRRRLLCPD